MVRPPSALGWLTVAHLLWGGLGVYVLLRSAGQGRWAATVAAASTRPRRFSWPTRSRAIYPHVWAACWYPWAFWAFGQARRGRARGCLLLPVVLALTFLTGHPQEWLLLVLALSAWSLADALARSGEREARAGAVVPAAGLGRRWRSCRSGWPPSTGPAARRPALAAPRSRRSRSESSIPRRYHLVALNAFQLLSPTALGGPSDYFGDDNYWETVLSIGLVPLVLAVVGALRHPDRRLVRGWLVLAGLAIWFACGRHLVLYSAAYSGRARR